MIYTLTLNPAIDREMTVSSIEFDSVLRATAQRVDCGGKGFNVSRMVAQLGGSSTAVGFAGGRGGELLRDMLAAQGIATEFVWVTGETRTNVSIVEAGRYVKCNERGPDVSAENITEMLAMVDRLAQPNDWWVLAGSLPPGVSADFYAQLTTRPKQAGANVLLDASGEALRLGCQAAPNLIKPNAEEAMELTGAANTHEAADALHQLGVATVIVSMGADGVLISAENEKTHVAAPPIVERNPIGAGDAMVGGVVWGLDSGLALQDAVSWGVACGSVAASLDGTAFGQHAQVEALRNKID